MVMITSKLCCCSLLGLLLPRNRSERFPYWVYNNPELHGKGAKAHPLLQTAAPGQGGWATNQATKWNKASGGTRCGGSGKSSTGGR
jgi:hypothetical protein